MAEYRSTEIRQHEILDTALVIIEEHGLKGLTVKSIAQRMGQVPSALYRHFRGKEAVLEALVERLQTYVNEGLSIARSQPTPLEGLDALLRRQLSLLETTPGVVKLVFGAFAFSPQAARRERIRAIWGSLRDEVALLIEKGKARGELRPGLNPTVAALAFLSIFQSAALMRHLEGADYPLSTVVLETWRMQQDALKTASRTPGA